MSAASDLIQRMEEETGQRIDENNGDNMAVAGLIGALSRIMGQSPASYTDNEDVAAGLLIQHQMSLEGQRKREAEEMIAGMLVSGLSPDDVKAIFG